MMGNLIVGGAVILLIAAALWHIKRKGGCECSADKGCSCCPVKKRHDKK